MMKRFLIGMAAIASLFATSCQNEIDSVNSEKTSTVSFKVETPEIQSRAYSDGATATVLKYAVYDAQGNELDKLTKTDATINGSTTVELKLTTGNEYSLIFWAESPDAPYNVNFAEKTMTVNYDGAKSNDENRDAFYKYVEPFKVSGAMTVPVELKRPFAQLNIGTADYAASKSAGYVPTHSSVKVSNVYKTLDLVSGDVSNLTSEDNSVTFSEDNSVTFASNIIPVSYNAEGNLVGEEFPVSGYEYLAMNYLLVSADKELIDIEYTYGTADNPDAKTRTVGSVPVQRNYRTNIYGNLLTSAVDFNVEINPDYEEDMYEDDDKESYQIYHVTVDGVSYTDFAEAVAKAIELKKPVEFVENVELAAGTNVIVKAGEELTLNLNGFTLNGTDNNTTGNFYLIDNKGTLVVNGPGLIGVVAKNERNTSSSSVAIANNPGGNLTVQNGVIVEHFGGTYMAYAIDNLTNGKGTSAITTINGATVKSTYRAVRQFLNGIEATNELTVKAGSVLEGANKSLFFHDPSAKANIGKLTVEDGAQLKGDVYLFVTSGSTEWPVEVSIPETALEGESTVLSANVPAGYLVVKKEGKWIVVDGVATTVAALTDALANGEGEIYLAAGEYTFPASSVQAGQTIICEEGTVFTGSSTLDINGATIIGATFSNPSGNASRSTINGTFKGCTFEGSNGLRYCYAGETVVFEDCVFSGSTYGVHFDGGANNIVFRNCTLSGFNAFAAATEMVTFEGCTFVGNGKSGYNGANLWGSAKMINCEFTFDGTTADEWIDCIGADKTYEFTNCTVNGTTFTNENYASFDKIFSRNNVKVKINSVECQL